MILEENKQYNFECKFTFPHEMEKKLQCSYFLFDKNIYIVSFIEGKRFSKHVYNPKDGELINFENYRSDLITCSGDSINELTTIYKDILQNINLISSTVLDKQLINIFNLITEPYVVDRSSFKYSFIDYEVKNKDKDNNYLYKNVTFYSIYAKEFTNYENKQYLNLDLFKDKNTYWYCISNSSGDKICKFIFKLEDLPTKYLFHLIHRENYHEKSLLINFEELKNHFKNLDNTSYEMHADMPNETVPYLRSCTYSYLSEVFATQFKLSLF